MVSEKNLQFLRNLGGGQYIVRMPKATLRQFERHIAEGELALPCYGRVWKSSW